MPNLLAKYLSPLDNPLSHAFKETFRKQHPLRVDDIPHVLSSTFLLSKEEIRNAYRRCSISAKTSLFFNPKKIDEQRQFTSNDDNQFFSPIHIRLFHNNKNKEKNHLANSSFLNGPIDVKKKKKQNCWKRNCMPRKRSIQWREETFSQWRIWFEEFHVKFWFSLERIVERVVYNWISFFSSIGDHLWSVLFVHFTRISLINRFHHRKKLLAHEEQKNQKSWSWVINWWSSFSIWWISTDRSTNCRCSFALIKCHGFSWSFFSRHFFLNIWNANSFF